MNNKVLSQESHEMTLAWHLSFFGAEHTALMGKVASEWRKVWHIGE